MTRIGILANPEAPATGPAVDRFLGMAQSRGVAVCLSEELRHLSDTVRADALLPAAGHPLRRAAPTLWN